MSGLKTLRFELSSDLSIEVQANPEDGDVRVRVEGLDDEANAVDAHGWFTPRQAREFAAAVVAAADDADPRDALLKTVTYALSQARNHPDDAGTHALVRAALSELERHS